MANCTALNTMCDQCRIAYTRVRNVIPELLDCPEGAHPVVFQCSFTGTDEQARQLVTHLRDTCRVLFSNPNMIHAAVRRAAEGGSSAGSWNCLTPQECSSRNDWRGQPPKVKHPKLLSKAPQLIGLWSPASPDRHPACVKAMSRLRDLTMLVDFPWAVQPGNEMQRLFVSKFGEKFRVRDVSHPDATGHASLHRLTWWGEIHPEQKP
ncbi:hypothetical protein BDW62DRAFT_200388 [Aspergillus aurantiobrunneus]